MKEEFRTIEGYEKYYVSNLGRVFSTETGKFLKMVEMLNGYFVVGLHKNKKQKNFYIHRLVAQTFIDNPNNYDTVDHRNGVKTDNRVENLQWLSKSENSKKFHREQITKEQKEYNKKTIRKAQEVVKIPIICIETGKIYESITQASNELNLYNIDQVIKGKRKTAGGYTFRFDFKE